MISGPRQGILSGLRRFAATAMSRDLTVFIIPGIDIARSYGLDIDAAGIRRVTSPRHASVLLVAGPLSPKLRNAAAVIYAQMLRPRALLVLGSTELPPLPAADITAELSQQKLVEAVHKLRSAFADGAFRPEVTDFDAPPLHIRIEYTCPMHPEVIQSEPGSCPKCGMTLIPHEAQDDNEYTQTDQSSMQHKMNDQLTTTHNHEENVAMTNDTKTIYTCSMHPEVVQDEPGSCPKCGMFLEAREVPVKSDEKSAESASVEYTCPMHPEVVQNEPGNCPKCGMFLVPR